MLDWLRRLRKVSQKLSLPSRDASSGRSQVQLNPAKLTPSADVYLGQLAVLTQLIAEQLDHQSENSGDSAFGKKLHKFSIDFYAAHSQLVEMLSKLGVDVSSLESKYGSRLQTMLERIQGSDHVEDLMLDYIGYGMLLDSYRKLAKGLTPAKRLKVEEILDSLKVTEQLFKALQEAIESDSKVGHRLAMYGRMIVADVLLEIRDSVDLSKIVELQSGLDAIEKARAQFKALEPYTSELIAEHTVRMGRLGLTA